MQHGRMPLAHLLLQAGRRLDAELREGLAERGWPRLSGAQSLVFAHLAESGTAPSDLARALGTTRQAQQDLVAGLVRAGLLEVVDDPARPRGRLVRLSARGRAMVREAGRLLAQAEERLGERGEHLRRLLVELDREQVPVARAAGAAGDGPVDAGSVDDGPGDVDGAVRPSR
ncbi:MarR family winged helix-turn-helix transcriptional regulator [Quadrisphaera sp. KR29]|uniref:MarR family winged helix-turn-helix transcriptional regulator n=1 Tax=Quadrisphaera sp. KR29 TaxID=3461391 RepID=UPI004043F766